MPLVVVGKGKRMETLPANCTGCALCQLACSFVKFGVFNPSRAYIAIARVGTDHKWHAEFTEQCDVCGYCFPFCKYDAIHMERVKGG